MDDGISRNRDFETQYIGKIDKLNLRVDNLAKEVNDIYVKTNDINRRLMKLES